MYGSLLRAADGDAVLAALNGQAHAGPGGDDAESLLRLVRAHGLAGLLADWRTCPAAAAAPLKALAAAQQAWVRAQLETAAEVAASFDALRVPYVFVKGVALAAGVYGRPEQRSFGDIDMLVEAEGLERAERALTDAGFEREATRPNPMQVHYVRRRGVGAMIDLHWAFTSSDSLLAPVRIPVGEILQRSRKVGPYRIPAPEDMLLLGAANLVRSCVPTMILVVDFARLAPLIDDWTAVRRRAEAWGLMTSTWLGLRLASDYLDARVPTEALAALSPARWRGDRILGLLGREHFWKLSRSRDIRYRFLLKLLCLDSAGDVLRACAAAPLGALRKLGLIGVSPHVFGSIPRP